MSTPGSSPDGMHRLAASRGPKVERQRFTPRSASSATLDSVTEASGLRRIEGDPTQGSFDLVRTRRFSVIRITGIRGEMEYAVGGRIAFLFVVRGNLRLSAPEHRYASSGESVFIVFPGIEQVRLSSDSPVEVIGLAFQQEVISPIRVSADSVELLHPDSTVFVASCAMLRALLSSDDPLTPNTSEAVCTLIEGAARGLVDAVSRPEHSLAERAIQIIALEHRDATLTPGRIAERLGVSTSTLNREFSGYSQGVSAQIRRHRAMTAVSLRAANPRLSLAELSEMAGFGSVDSMRRAQRWSEDSDPVERA